MLETGLTRGPLEYRRAELRAAREQVAAAVEKASIAALAVFTKHVGAAIVSLESAYRMHPANKPDPLPEVRGRPWGEQNTIQFFGCSPRLATVSLLTEWGIYLDEWKDLPESKKSMLYWFSHDAREDFPNLSLLGRWYSQHQTSSVGVERLFGQMRTMEVPVRGAMKCPTFVSTLKFRSNRWLLEKRTQAEYERLSDLTR